jgi:hypothetical protein
MITICLLLCGCQAEEMDTEDIQSRYQQMAGCTMEAVVRCEQEGMEWEAELKCEYVPDGSSMVEVLSPETISGIKVVLDDTEWHLEYEDMVLDAMPVSAEHISPAACLPFLITSLRNGWVLEENMESWNDVPCYRITVDQSGEIEKIISTLWILQEDMTPLRGEISVGGEIILTAEFTSFAFYDTIKK